MSAKKPPKLDKRAAILDAALTEFAEVGFGGASTNAIAEAASVAKGLVFHHFGTKEELFLAVADDVNAALGARFQRFLDDPPQDLFERILLWTDVKIALVKEDPRRLRFYLGALTDAPDAVRDEVRARGEAMARALLPRLLDNVDAGKLRAGVSLEDALEAFMVLGAGLERMMMPLLKGRARSHAAQTSMLDTLTARSKRVLELLRDGLYR